MYIRTVNSLSLLTDIFVEAERLQKCLEVLRDELVKKPDEWHSEVHEAMCHCRRIQNELRSIKSLQGGIARTKWQREFEANLGETPIPEPPKPQPPKGLPKLKLIG
jgi:hypothetical protein